MACQHPIKKGRVFIYFYTAHVYERFFYFNANNANEQPKIKSWKNKKAGLKPAFNAKIK